jgi:putative ABC transport system permease protein
VKTAGDPRSVLQGVREQVAKLDAEEPVYNARSLEDLVKDQHAFFRFNAMLMAVFAGMALALSAIGIYGVVTYAVSQRRREFGIRLALGSSRKGILTMVLRQAAWMSVLGMGVGVMLGWPATRLLAGTLRASMFLTLRPAGSVLYAGLCVGMAATMVLSCLMPAFRAAQADPIETLRGE